MQQLCVITDTRICPHNSLDGRFCDLCDIPTKVQVKKEFNATIPRYFPPPRDIVRSKMRKKNGKVKIFTEEEIFAYEQKNKNRTNI